MKKLFTALTCSVLSLSYALASSTNLPDFGKDQKSSPSSGSSSFTPEDEQNIAHTRKLAAEIREMAQRLPILEAREKAIGTKEALDAIEKIKETRASTEFLNQGFEELVARKGEGLNQDQVNEILIRNFVQHQAKHGTPDISNTQYAKEVESLGNEMQSVANRFVAATEKSPALSKKVKDESDETRGVIQATMIEVMTAAAGTKFATAESVIPAKKAIKKLMIVLCGTLDLKPNPDASAVDLMAVVSNHLKDKYKV